MLFECCRKIVAAQFYPKSRCIAIWSSPMSKKTGTKLLYHKVSPLWTYWAGNWNLRPQRQIRFLKNENSWAMQSAFVPFWTNIPTAKNLILKENIHKIILNFQIPGNEKRIRVVIAVNGTFHRNFARLLHPASYFNMGIRWHV